MRQSTKRKRREAYRDEPEPAAEIVPLRDHNGAPVQLVFPGDIVTIGGLQTYKVRTVEWSEAWGDYFVHGSFGPCKFYLLQRDVRREAH